MERPKPPLSVLIVEDEALLAMDVGMMVEDAGHTVIGEAASLYEVEELEPPKAPDIAFVDMQLARNTTGLDVCAHIQKRWSHTIIIFVTANPNKIPDDFAGAHGVIPKPFSRHGFMNALWYLQESVCRPPPNAALPGSFLASPHLASTW
ncbi:MULTISPECIES: response regulator [Rhizobium]|uniref:Response regulator n=1 Tax=Rhizobium rhododendri TaxID=2506430 RepID=A0ABY8IU57_9HYPH|nr:MULTISPECIES: response regulator [Rhizobium]MBO9100673.1 response regulator [Rhizobium sp. L58/93]MBO9135966.1 response regulator [Rhizobium sp. B209b/85]MBO9171277.1 response regulator [Rhizobium sp. L245/93]MBO9187144.1 response regulator [Rhizobium sp. E27B/91]MBZ5759286.1 response regulator [Rhizobium sp. VS19-DR96]